MINSKKGIALAILFPIFCLVLLTAYKKYILSIGKEITLPITGYDPRDLLAGHYLVYRVDYGITPMCPNSDYRTKKEAYVCLSPKKFSYDKISDCKTFIKGTCTGSRFIAGIERYYIPQSEAKELEKKVMNKNASIVISVTSEGVAQIKNLLIEGKPWN